MVTFSKKNNIYKVTRITGNRDNILGISFAEKNSSDKTIEVVEWDFPNTDRGQIRTSKEEVVKQVLAGLNSFNEYFKTDYRVSKIYYVPFEDGSESIYRTLFRMLLKHYHSGNEFQEWKAEVTFSKEDNIYKITRITSNRSTLLGISFPDETNGDDSVEVVEWEFPNIDNSIIRTSKKKVLRQVMAGLKSINEALGTDYRVSKIYYVPSEDGPGSTYKTLLYYLIKHYHNGNEFQESKPKA